MAINIIFNVILYIIKLSYSIRIPAKTCLPSNGSEFHFQLKTNPLYFGIWGPWHSKAALDSKFRNMIDIFSFSISSFSNFFIHVHNMFGWRSHTKKKIFLCMLFTNYSIFLRRGKIWMVHKEIKNHRIPISIALRENHPKFTSSMQSFLKENNCPVYTKNP